MATWPPDVVVELFYDGVWNDVTSDVRLTSDIEVELGVRNEGANAADPADLTLTLNNGLSRVNPGVSGRYSPKNPRSDLFGKIDKGTRIRVRVDDPPAVPTPFLTDEFERTESDGWGAADTGQTWSISSVVGGADADYSVSDGLGRLAMTSVDPVSLRMIIADLADKKTDLDVTCTMQTDQRSISTTGLEAIFGSVCARVSDDGLDFVTGAVWFAADSGLPNGAGLRVATSLVAVVDGSNVEEVQGTVIPDLVYEVGTPLNVRFVIEGPEVRMRVWATGDTEPVLWHAQAHLEQVTNPGDFAIFTQGSAEGTAVPVTVSVDHLSVSDVTPTDDAVRGVFEIYEFPPRWDISDSDQWVPIVANGILRRLRQGTQPIKSALRRYIPSVFPVAYWPLEDTGSIGRFGVEAVAGGQSLAMAGVKFAEDDEVPGSEPLPELQESSGFVSPGIGTSPFMRCNDVSAIETGSWSVHMLVRLPSDDFPASGSHTLLQFHTTGEAGLWTLRAEQVSGGPGLRLRVVDQDSVLIDEQTASETASLAAGGPRLTDDWRVISIRVNDDGSGNTDYRFDWFTLDGGSSWGNGATYASPDGTGRFRRIRTTFSPDLAGMRFGHLSAWGLRDPVGYFDQLTLLHPALGFAGEEARERARRVTTEERITTLIEGSADTPMGGQSVTTVNDLVEEAAIADVAILTEQRNESGLFLRARELMYNQEPVLVFDYANGEIFEPFEPTDDDQRIRNSITVSREGGASATAVQREGTLNVNSPVDDPNGVGEYPASFSINVDSDDQLPDYAGWRLHLGTVDELRYPRVTINLANERIRPMIDDILAIREGTKIIIVNPPTWLPADDVELIVEGYKETLNAFTWLITLVCSPASPWTVGGVAGLDTLLSEDFEDADLAITVTNAGDAAWFRTQDDVLFGEWSFRAGAILDSQTSDAVIEVPDQAVGLQLWYKVSSEEAADFFRVLVDGEEVLSESGVRFWQQSDVINVQGATAVTLRYEKDGAGSSGDDTVYVDNVEFLALASGPQEPDRSDTSGSVLLEAIDEDGTELLVLTERNADPFVPLSAEWVGSAEPLNPNGDFEVDLAGWTGDDATLARVETPNGTQQFGGVWSMQITPDGVGEFPNAGSDLIPVTEGRAFAATAWLRNDSTRLMSLSLNWFDAGFNFISNDFRDQTVQSDVWTFFDVQGTAPAGAAFANIAPTIPDFPATTDVGYADEVFLRFDESWSLPQEVPFNVRLSPNGGSSGEVVQVQSVEPLTWDTFTRTETDEWGGADSGQTWDGVLDLGNTDVSVDGSRGLMTITADPSTVRFQQITDTAVTDTDIVVTMSPDQVATGASILPSVLLRAAGAYYRARVHFGTGGSMFASVTRVTTQIGSSPALPWTYAADDVFWARVKIVGQRILMRVWPDGVTEPRVWHIDRAVEDDPIDSGAIGVTLSAFAGNTNVNPTVAYDDFRVITPQAFTVERGINDVQTAQPAGTDVRLAQPPTVAL